MINIIIQDVDKKNQLPLEMIESCKLELQKIKNNVEFTLRLVDEKEIQFLNKTYAKKDKVTNVLSFGASNLEHIKAKLLFLGDIIICKKKIIDEAFLQNKTISAHFSHMIIHGYLHLLGYDHNIANRAKEMEAIEIKVLSNLGIKSPFE